MNKSEFVMDIVDLHDPSRVSRTPDEIKVLLSGKFVQDEFTVTKVELRLYNEKQMKTWVFIL